MLSLTPASVAARAIEGKRRGRFVTFDGAALHVQAVGDSITISEWALDVIGPVRSSSCNEALSRRWRGGKRRGVSERFCAASQARRSMRRRPPNECSAAFEPTRGKARSDLILAPIELYAQKNLLMTSILSTPVHVAHDSHTDDLAHSQETQPSSANGASVDLPRIERAVREILIAVGEDPDREGLRKTPNRVARSYVELMAGLRSDPKTHLRTVFTNGYNQVVLLRNIPFHSMCEHHLLPFTGHAHVAYLPDGKVVGLSKIARLVDAFALRPQLQERLTDQIADAMMEGLQPLGAVCMIEATHTCMTIRGIKKEGSTMVTSAIRGVFKTDQASRSEVLALIHGTSRLA